MARIVMLATSVSFVVALAHPVRAVDVVAAGDIASSGPGDTLTSDRVIALDPDAVLTLGDHAYTNGSSSEFAAYYDPTWGRFRTITHPSPGNHDWRTSGAAGYESYFGLRAGRVHSFVLGRWRVISLDSNVHVRSSEGASRRGPRGTNAAVSSSSSTTRDGVRVSMGIRGPWPHGGAPRTRTVSM